MPSKNILVSASEIILGRNSKNSFKVVVTPSGKPGDHRRTFTKYQMDDILYQQNGKCASSRCQHKKLDPRAIQFEHKKPWAFGGRTIFQYGRVVCLECHSSPEIEEKLRKTSKKRKQKKHVSFF